MSAALSRRAALTGAVASVAMVGAAVVVAAPVLPVSSPSSAAWDVAMKRYVAAKAAADAFDRAHINIPGTLPLGPERSAAIDAIAPHVWNDAERLTDVEYDTGIALLAMPAPHLQALRWKLERVLVIENGEMVAFSEAHVAQTMADMRRLLSVEASG